LVDKLIGNYKGDKMKKNDFARACYVSGMDADLCSHLEFTMDIKQKIELIEVVQDTYKDFDEIVESCPIKYSEEEV